MSQLLLSYIDLIEISSNVIIPFEVIFDFSPYEEENIYRNMKNSNKYQRLKNGIVQHI